MTSVLLIKQQNEIDNLKRRLKLSQTQQRSEFRYTEIDFLLKKKNKQKFDSENFQEMDIFNPKGLKIGLLKKHVEKIHRGKKNTFARKLPQKKLEIECQKRKVSVSLKRLTNSKIKGWCATRNRNENTKNDFMADDIDSNEQVPSSHSNIMCSDIRINESRYSVKSSLRIQKLKRNNKTLECAICNILVSLKNMNRHISTVHGGEKTFKCNDCTASFQRKDKLKEHINTGKSFSE